MSRWQLFKVADNRSEAVNFSLVWNHNIVNLADVTGAASNLN